MSDELRPGLYEQVITTYLQAQLEQVQGHLVVEDAPLHAAEAADRIALHLSRLIVSAIESIPDNQRVVRGVQAARSMLEALEQAIERADLDLDLPIEPARVLRALLRRSPAGVPAPIEAPLTPLLDTTLLTNAPDEPRVGHQLRAEITSADRIDLVMAFIRRSGIAPLTDALRRHCESGRSLRVLTTTYTGSTERRALDLLRDLGAEIRVSYDTTSTRLHAKAWLFHRASGFSTAYIGSSNLTYSAQVAGLEWNVRVSGARNGDVIDKVGAVFDSYWEGGEFHPYVPEQFEEQTAVRGTGPQIFLSPVEIRLHPFQERLLEQIQLQRQRGHHRNLLAAATGTGKTVMAAVDYAGLQKTLRRSRLLFVAHRREILEQSQATFRHALRDPAFGEQWVAGRRPTNFEHVFGSVQSLSRADLESLPPDHFDVVIIDEFHHAAAPSYESLLNHIEPKELLGLTATPERSDGLPILTWFGNQIAAELRLWDAIDQHRLVPFVYYGIHDGVDLQQVPWRRGRGYDVEALGNVYTSSDTHAHLVIEQIEKHVDDLGSLRGLGFCVSIDHARFMARKANDAGLPSIAVWADTPADERRKALARLANGSIKILFSVDLFNEGVDVATVNTLLMLRPTDSPTLFLQQLGRGLRRSEGKAVCQVLDFVGNHHKEFRFDRRLRALFGGTRRDVERQVRMGFPFLPAGCHMELDSVASEIVLKSIREAVPSQWRQKVGELQALVTSGRRPTLSDYLEQTGLELADVYVGKRGWSDLCQDAGVSLADPGPHEVALRRAVGRLLHVDDESRLQFYLDTLQGATPPDVESLGERERRLLRMLVASLVQRAVEKSASLQEGANCLWEHSQIMHELRELFGELLGSIDHIHQHIEGRPEVPLEVHARYTRVEMLAALHGEDRATVGAWQTGVRWLPEASIDLCAFTLDKTVGSFSPTTRYRDYAISQELLHWESQSVVRAASSTGQRYQHHVQLGSDIMLFARLRQNDRAFWFLGPATYVRHEGERPMAIVWRLRYPLPGDLFARFAAAVA